MAKILSQSGVSLADIYDVEGSIAGIDTLDTRSLPIVHEIGASVWSERASGAIRRTSTGALAQNTTWDLQLDNLPASINRILGVFVFTDNAARIQNAQVSVGSGGREQPLWFWDVNEQNIELRLQDDGGAVAVVFGLCSDRNMGAGTLPSMAFGSVQPQPIDDIIFRGDTAGFGAGAVTVTALIYIGFSEVGRAFGVSSYGLPVPSW